jgi:hypothetical protein
MGRACIDLPIIEAKKLINKLTLPETEEEKVLCLR